MAYARGAYTSFTSLPSPESTTVVSARGIDVTTGKYQVEEDGSFTPMSGAAQCVYCATCFDAGAAPQTQGPQEFEARKQRLVAAVEPLTDGKSPAIATNNVTVDEDGAGGAVEVVDYRTLHTEEDEPVTF